jgi:hypothetical protein
MCLLILFFYQTTINGNFDLPFMIISNQTRNKAHYKIKHIFTKVKIKHIFTKVKIEIVRQ